MDGNVVVKQEPKETEELTPSLFSWTIIKTGINESNVKQEQSSDHDTYPVCPVGTKHTTDCDVVTPTGSNKLIDGSYPAGNTQSTDNDHVSQTLGANEVGDDNTDAYTDSSDEDNSEKEDYPKKNKGDYSQKNSTAHKQANSFINTYNPDDVYGSSDETFYSSGDENLVYEESTDPFDSDDSLDLLQKLQISNRNKQIEIDVIDDTENDDIHVCKETSVNHINEKLNKTEKSEEHRGVDLENASSVNNERCDIDSSKSRVRAKTDDELFKTDSLYTLKQNLFMNPYQVYLKNRNSEIDSGVNRKTSVSTPGCRPYKCLICGDRFRSRSQLNRHASTHSGSKNSEYSCSNCNKCFFVESEYKSHIVQKQCVTDIDDLHRDEDLTATADVSVSNTDGSELVSSSRNPYTQCENPGDRALTTQFQCDVCCRKFKCIASLNQHYLHHEKHLENFHPVSNRKMAVFKCDLCDREFKQSKYLKQHYKSHREMAPYKCDLCDKRFFAEYNLQQHKQTHPLSVRETTHLVTDSSVQKGNIGTSVDKKEDSYWCDICGRQFTSKRALERHANAEHIDNDSYKCKYCDELFVTDEDLQHHMAIHKSFKCSHCTKVFKTESAMEKHVRVQHPVDSPYTCIVCSKGFFAKYNLSKHLQEHGIEDYGKKQNESNYIEDKQNKCDESTPQQTEGSNKEQINKEQTEGNNKEQINRELTEGNNKEQINEEQTEGNNKEQINKEQTEGNNKEQINKEQTEGNNKEQINKEQTEGNNKEQINREQTEGNNKEQINKEQTEGNNKEQINKEQTSQSCDENLKGETKFCIGRNSDNQGINTSDDNLDIPAIYYPSEHVNNHSVNSASQRELFRCKYCKKEFKFKNSKNYHVSRQHPEECCFICQTCQRGFFIKSFYLNHIKTHDKDFVLICDKSVDKQNINETGSIDKDKLVVTNSTDNTGINTEVKCTNKTLIGMDKGEIDTNYTEIKVTDNLQKQGQTVQSYDRKTDCDSYQCRRCLKQFKSKAKLKKHHQIKHSQHQVKIIGNHQIKHPGNHHQIKHSKLQVKFPEHHKIKSPEHHKIKSPEHHQIKHSKLQVKSPEQQQIKHCKFQVKTPEQHQIKHSQHQVKITGNHQIKHPGNHHQIKHSKLQVKSPEQQQIKSPEHHKIKSPEQHQIKHSKLQIKSPEHHQIKHCKFQVKTPEQHQIKHSEHKIKYSEHKIKHSEHHIKHSEQSGTYNCKVCGKGFYHQTNLQSHMNIHVARLVKKETLTCDCCHHGFMSEALLKEHMPDCDKNKHVNDQSADSHYKDSYNTSSDSLVHSHSTTHHELYKASNSLVQTGSDKHCDQQYDASVKDFGDNGCNKTSLDGYFKCKICNKVFDTRKKMQTHFRTKHAEYAPYQCKICVRGFAREQNYINHLQKHHDKMMGEINQSGLKNVNNKHKKTPEDSVMITNKVTVENQKEINRNEDNVCMEELSEEHQDQEANWRKSENQEKPLKEKHKNYVDISKVLHKTQDNINKDMCTKKNIKRLRFKCHICPRRFINEKLKRRHLESHVSELAPFICRVCGYGFFIEAHFEKHVYGHDSFEPIISAENTHCSKSNKVSNNQALLERHVIKHGTSSSKFARKWHIGKQFECKLCSREFQLEKTLKDHVCVSKVNTQVNSNEKTCNYSEPSEIKTKVVPEIDHSISEVEGERRDRVLETYKNDNQDLQSCVKIEKMDTSDMAKQSVQTTDVTSTEGKPQTGNNSRQNLFTLFSGQLSDMVSQVTPEKPKDASYICSICQIGFIYKQNLDNHLLMHKVKLHSCSICHKKFKHYFVMQRHIYKRHSNLSGVSPSGVGSSCVSPPGVGSSCVSPSGIGSSYVSPLGVGSSCVSPSGVGVGGSQNKEKNYSDVDKRDCVINKDRHIKCLKDNETLKFMTSKKRTKSKTQRGGKRQPIKQKPEEDRDHQHEGDTTNLSNKDSFTSLDVMEKPFICNICENGFRTHNELDTHILIHNKEDLYKCGFCGKAFSKIDNMMKHMKIHRNKTKAEKYKCTVCRDKTFSTYMMLKHHMTHKHHSDKTHSHHGDTTYNHNLNTTHCQHKPSPFKCDICHKTFSVMATLKRHSLLHLNRRPFQCKVCGQSFNRKDNCKIHERRHSEQLVK